MIGKARNRQVGNADARTIDGTQEQIGDVEGVINDERWHKHDKPVEAAQRLDRKLSMHRAQEMLGGQ